MFRSEEELISLINNGGQIVFDWYDKVVGHNRISSKFFTDILRGEIDGVLIPDSGLVISGAVFVGDILLRGVTIENTLDIFNSNILGVLDLSYASVENVCLRGTVVEKLLFNHLKCSGNLVLSYGFRSCHTVEGMGAEIQGQLGCSGGEFFGLPVAARFEQLKVKGPFFWREMNKYGVLGVLDLTGAEVGTLIDDSHSWPRIGNLVIDGFKFSNLGGNTNPDYFDRQSWLMRQTKAHLTYDFRPYPFEQTKMVLKNQGRDKESVKIAILKNKLQRRANFIRRDNKLAQLTFITERQEKTLLYYTGNIFDEMRMIEALNKNQQALDAVRKFEPIRDISASLSWLKDWFHWVLVGYGYRPQFALAWLLIIGLIGGYFFHVCNDKGILTSVDVGSDRFSAIAYAADALIPLIDLNVEKNWKFSVLAPAHVMFLNYMYIFSGWFLTAIFAASVTGLVKK